MSIVILQLQNVDRKKEIRLKKCRYCPGETLQRWGKVKEPVQDNRYRNVQEYRYRCCTCHHTFRYYPEVIDQADQMQQLRKRSAHYWILGMSLRGTRISLLAFGIKISHRTVWRDLQEQARQAEARRHWQPVRVLGIDGPYRLT